MDAWVDGRLDGIGRATQCKDVRACVGACVGGWVRAWWMNLAVVRGGGTRWGRFGLARRVGWRAAAGVAAATRAMMPAPVLEVDGGSFRILQGLTMDVPRMNVLHCAIQYRSCER